MGLKRRCKSSQCALSGGKRLDVVVAKRMSFASDKHATANKDGKLLKISAMVREIEKSLAYEVESAAGIDMSGFRICVWHAKLEEKDGMSWVRGGVQEDAGPGGVNGEGATALKKRQAVREINLDFGG